MVSSTSRLDRLARALQQARPDFTLHNARRFAREVIDAPDNVFVAKPLTYLPAHTPGTGGNTSGAGGQGTPPTTRVEESPSDDPAPDVSTDPRFMAIIAQVIASAPGLDPRWNVVNTRELFAMKEAAQMLLAGQGPVGYSGIDDIGEDFPYILAGALEDVADHAGSPVKADHLEMLAAKIRHAYTAETAREQWSRRVTEIGERLEERREVGQRLADTLAAETTHHDEGKADPRFQSQAKTPAGPEVLAPGDIIVAPGVQGLYLGDGQVRLDSGQITGIDDIDFGSAPDAGTYRLS